MVVLVEKFEEVGWVEVGVVYNCWYVGEGGGCGVNFGDEGFNGFEDGVGIVGEIVGMIFVVGV